MIHFVLCDDAEKHNQILSRHIMSIIDQLSEPCSIALETTDPKKVMEYAEKQHEKTVYFIDIVFEHEKLSGMDLCRFIHQHDPEGYVIYVTAYGEYALECIQTHAFDLILKPYSIQRLKKSLEDVLHDITEKKSMYPLKVTAGSLTQVLDQKKICYIQVERECVTAHFSKGHVTWRESLNQLMERLNPRWFVRIHKSYAINKLYFQSIDRKTQEITLKTGAILPVSRRRIRKLEEEL